jgi:hypothetical protein
MAAQLRDDGYQPSVKLVRPRAFAKLVSDCKNPPEPSTALVEMFASRKAMSNKA